jgi:peroxiredoxin
MPLPHSQRKQRGGTMDLTGKPAVPFSLPDAEGRLRRLEDFGGHWLLLVFHRHLG